MKNSRSRILYFLENQNIKKSDFLQKTGLNKGFVDKAHQDSGISDVYLSIILENYPEISAEWLIAGKGEMLKNKSDNLNNDFLKLQYIIEIQKELISTQRKNIIMLEELLKRNN